MNDFTKEELKTMRNMMFSAMGSSSLWRTNDSNVLVDKIQSMIDNYSSIYCKCQGAWICDECHFKEKEHE